MNGENVNLEDMLNWREERSKYSKYLSIPVPLPCHFILYEHPRANKNK